MLKVFLVEDEFIVREGIKNNIDWAGHGYDFCGEAADGELAYTAIQKCRPDIVITDIRMPFMDGLELSGLIRKELPETEIIILTGFEEFEYAKKAISIGVADFLNKPISGEDLLKAVDALAEKITSRKAEREIQTKYLQEMEEKTRGDQKVLFDDLLKGEKSVPELLRTAEELGVDLSASWYNLLLLTAISGNHAYDAYSGTLVKVEKSLRDLCEQRGCLLFDRGLEGLAILFKEDSREALKQKIAAFLEPLKAIYAEYPRVRYFGGLGEPVERLSQLPTCFEKASRALAHRYFVKENRIVSEADFGQETLQKEELPDLQNVDLKQIDRDKVREFLKTGERHEVPYFVEEFFHGIDSGVLRSNMFRQYITMDAYFGVVSFLDELHLDRSGIEALDAESGALADEHRAMEYISRILDQALTLREASASSQYRDVAAEVMNYIEENYADEELSLNVVAAHVNFSPNHLSTVFSQQTGQPFIKYLTDYRMNRAKELLRCTSKKSSMIASEVGYKDPHYFSFLFKKTQGMTPTQYRSGTAETES